MELRGEGCFRVSFYEGVDDSGDIFLFCIAEILSFGFAQDRLSLWSSE
jgi:hypothetical protein